MREPDWVPVNKFLIAGTVPANKFLFAGRVPANNLFQFSNLIFALKQDLGPTRLKVDRVKLQKLAFLSH